MPTVISGTDGVSQVQAGAVESTDLPAGSVIQVVRNSSGSDIDSTTTTFVDAITASITPSSVNSKILVIGMLYGAIRRGISPMFYKVKLRRNGTDIGIVENNGLNNIGFEQSNNTKWNAYQDCVFDEPSSTSLQTYSIAFAHTDKPFGGYSPDKVSVSNCVLILMEIAG